jgi:hypothetical protein
VGLFDFFKRRRERESAIQAPASADTGDAQAVVGQLGPMIQKAIAEGNVTIEQGPSQTIDMRGTGLREEIVGIMKQHGIDPETASPGENIDAAAYGDMQQQILAALAKHGIDPNASGSSIDFRVQREED